MIRSHHITAELARQHQSELMLAGRTARGGTDVEPVATAEAQTSAAQDGEELRHARRRFHRHGHRGARPAGRPRPASRGA